VTVSVPVPLGARASGPPSRGVRFTSAGPVSAAVPEPVSVSVTVSLTVSVPVSVSATVSVPVTLPVSLTAPVSVPGAVSVLDFPS
jgi:hypothetical protein